MKLRHRVLAFALGFALPLAASIVPLSAQEPSTPGQTEPAKARTYDPTRRVPRYFGQVGLTPEQKESIYKIVAKHQQKIEALQKQLADERAAVLKECEGVLNDQQKQTLDARRKANLRGSSATRSTPATTPAPAADGPSS